MPVLFFEGAFLGGLGVWWWRDDQRRPWGWIGQVRSKGETAPDPAVTCGICYHLYSGQTNRFRRVGLEPCGCQEGRQA
jgi:hypothetical protein